MTSSIHLPITIYQLPKISYLRFFIEESNAKHFRSLKIDNCKLIIGATKGSDL